jgi:hypothetical protein
VADASAASPRYCESLRLRGADRASRRGVRWSWPRGAGAPLRQRRRRGVLCAAARTAAPPSHPGRRARGAPSGPGLRARAAGRRGDAWAGASCAAAGAVHRQRRHGRLGGHRALAPGPVRAAAAARAPARGSRPRSRPRARRGALVRRRARTTWWRGAGGGRGGAHERAWSAVRRARRLGGGAAALAAHRPVRGAPGPCLGLLGSAACGKGSAFCLSTCAPAPSAFAGRPRVRTNSSLFRHACLGGRSTSCGRGPRRPAPGSGSLAQQLRSMRPAQPRCARAGATRAACRRSAARARSACTPAWTT